MNAEISQPEAEKPPALPQTFTNGRQVFLFALLTLILTVVTVAGGRAWLRNYETLTFVVGDPLGPEARFANRLAAVLKDNNGHLAATTAAQHDGLRLRPLIPALGMSDER